MATGSVSPKSGKIVDIPNTPTIGTATAGVESASLTFTAPTVGGPIRTYTALSSPGSITGTGTTSPISITGLTGGTAYTFQIRAENATGNSPYSSASNSVTPTVSNSYESIATVTVGSGGAASAEFTSIPATYSHLQLRYIARNDTANYFVRIRFNGSTTASDYVYHILNGTGAAVTVGYENDGMYAPRQSNAANTFGAGVVDILDYTSTNKYKTIRGIGGRDANGSGDVDFLSGFYKANTNAITSIQITVAGGNYTQYSHFALYGIKSS